MARSLPKYGITLFFVLFYFNPAPSLAGILVVLTTLALLASITLSLRGDDVRSDTVFRHALRGVILSQFVIFFLIGTLRVGVFDAMLFASALAALVRADEGMRPGRQSGPGIQER
jgi:hypothetical protein